MRTNDKSLKHNNLWKRGQKNSHFDKEALLFYLFAWCAILLNSCVIRVIWKYLHDTRIHVCSGADEYVHWCRWISVVHHKKIKKASKIRNLLVSNRTHLGPIGTMYANHFSSLIRALLYNYLSSDMVNFICIYVMFVWVRHILVTFSIFDISS